jgi:histidinol-phosphate phosphatase family protein
MNRAVFIDRDGTIAADVHYCSRPEDFQLFPRVPDAIKTLSDNGFKIVIVTNQSGIARGYFTEDTLSRIHEKMVIELGIGGAHIDAIYYCLHHPDELCDCRKPGLAMYYKAIAQFDIDPQKSFVIGDLPMDIAAGKALRCKTILVNTAATRVDMAGCNPDLVAETFFDAVSWIIGNK